MSASKIFPALSIVSIGLATAAIVISRAPAPGVSGHPPRKSPEVGDTRELEGRISTLAVEVSSLRAELDALRTNRREPEVVDSPAIDPSESVPERETEFDGRIAEAVEQVLEQREQEQREAKLQGQREAMAKWVDTRLDQLPTVYQGIAEKMTLPAGVRGEVEDIIAATFEEVAVRTDRLMASPPPPEEESYRIMGEMKEIVGTMITDLDTVLTADELIVLGQITADAEMPRIGGALIEEGKRDYAEEHGEDVDSP